MKRLAFIGLAVVLVAAIALGSLPSRHRASSADERIRQLSAEIRCPTCRGLSVGQSESPLAQSARTEISQRVGAGQSDTQIKDYFVSRYGDSALMSPKHSGFSGTVWILPGVFAVLATGGVVFAVRRWSASRADVPTTEDQRLVESALGVR